MNYRILFTSKNNYDLLENWIQKCSGYKLPEIINLDLGSNKSQHNMGLEFCKKNNIKFIKANRTEFQDNIKQALNYLAKIKVEYLLYLHQDCFPVNRSTLCDVDFCIKNNDLSEFGCIGFNIYHDAEIGYLNQNFSNLMTTSRCVLQKGNGYYMRYPKGSRVNYDNFKKNQAFSVENVMWTALLLSSKSFFENIKVDLDFNFFLSPDDMAYQFLSKKVHNIVIPNIEFIHDQKIKTKFKIPKDSPIGKIEEVEKNYGKIFGIGNVWRNKWGFSYDPKKKFKFFNNRYIKFLFTLLLNKIYSNIETRSRSEYKLCKSRYSLFDSYYNHDPYYGPLKYFNLKTDDGNKD